MKQKPSIQQGTRDFSPENMVKCNYIFQTIRDVFHLFGFQQIETPTMENLSTLMGKYQEVQHLLSLVNRLRQGGISTEIYPDTVKMKKQMSYADAKKIPFVALAGENEIAEQVVQLKDMTTGEQRKVALEEMVSFAKQIFSKNICLFLKYIISLLRKATNHN